MTYIKQIKQGIAKQKELWIQYNQMKPTPDMLPGERAKRLRKCEEIHQEIISTRTEVQRLDHEMKQERHLVDLTMKQYVDSR